MNKAESLFFYSVTDKEKWLKILELYGFVYTGSKNDYYHVFENKTTVTQTVLDIDYDRLTVYQGSSILKQEIHVIYKGYLPLNSVQLELLLNTFLGLKMTQSSKEEYLRLYSDGGSSSQYEID